MQGKIKSVFSRFENAGIFEMIPWVVRRRRTFAGVALPALGLITAGIAVGVAVATLLPQRRRDETIRDARRLYEDKLRPFVSNVQQRIEHVGSALQKEGEALAEHEGHTANHGQYGTSFGNNISERNI